MKYIVYGFAKSDSTRSLCQSIENELTKAGAQYAYEYYATPEGIQVFCQKHDVKAIVLRRDDFSVETLTWIASVTDATLCVILRTTDRELSQFFKIGLYDAVMPARRGKKLGAEIADNILAPRSRQKARIYYSLERANIPEDVSLAHGKIRTTNETHIRKLLQYTFLEEDESKVSERYAHAASLLSQDGKAILALSVPASHAPLVSGLKAYEEGLVSAKKLKGLPVVSLEGLSGPTKTENKIPETEKKETASAVSSSKPAAAFAAATLSAPSVSKEDNKVTDAAVPKKETVKEFVSEPPVDIKIPNVRVPVPKITVPAPAKKEEAPEKSTVETPKAAAAPAPVKCEEHRFRYSVRKASTCTSEGEEEGICMTCGYRILRALPKIEHLFGQWSVTRPATCKEDGVSMRSCAACGFTEETVIPMKAGEHTFGEYVTVTEPTCTETGLAKRTCTVCGYSESKELPVDKNSHAFSEYKITEAASCIRPGRKERVCTRCGYTESEAVPVDPNAHRFGEWETVKAPDCKNEGVKRRVCADCGKEITAPIAVDENAHVFGPWKETKQATCSSYGEKVHTCINCGFEDVAEVPKNPNAHIRSGVPVVLQAPSCVKAGVGQVTCRECNKQYNVTLPKTDEHEWDEGVVVKAPNCSEPGERLFTCAVCGATETEPIAVDPTAHTASKTMVKIVREPNCSEPGLSICRCTRCKDKMEVPLDIDPNVHTYSLKQTVVQEPTCQKPGVAVRACTLCGKEKEEEIPKVNHKYEDHVCIYCGKREKRMAFWWIFAGAAAVLLLFAGMLLLIQHLTGRSIFGGYGAETTSYEVASITTTAVEPVETTAEAIEPSGEISSENLTDPETTEEVSTDEETEVSSTEETEDSSSETDIETSEGTTEENTEGSTEVTDTTAESVTEATTEAPSTDAPTEAPTQEPTQEPTEAPTQAPTQPKVVLSAVHVALRDPSRTYYIGDLITVNDITVTASYSNGQTKSINGWGADGLTYIQTNPHVIRVWYSEDGISKETTIHVAASQKPVPPTQAPTKPEPTTPEPTQPEPTQPPTPTLVALAAKANRNDFVVGQTLTTSDFTVTATYSNRQSVTVDGYTIKTTKLKEGTNLITIEYMGLRATVNIEVAPAQTTAGGDPEILGSATGSTLIKRINAGDPVVCTVRTSGGTRTFSVNCTISGDQPLSKDEAKALINASGIYTQKLNGGIYFFDEL